MINDLREQRGLQFAQAKESQVNQVDEFLYVVKSQSGNGEYTVNKVDGEWYCTCPDNTYRQVKCKHVFAVELSLKMKEQVKRNVVIQPIWASKCVYCGSEYIVKDAIRHNKKYDLQRYLCKGCGKRFSINIDFEGMKASPQIITSAMQLYFTGESLRNIQKFLKLQGVTISHVSVLKWINKYIALMSEYLGKIKPNVSDTWRADEIYIKFSGNMKYLFAMMDDETRFWIAQEVADSKYTHDARNLLRVSKELTGKKSQVFVTDGLPSYHVAYKKEFYTHKKETRTEHIRHIKLKGDIHNNKMERMNGEFRDREKTMRGLKKPDTQILKGYQLYHNYIRPHESLNGKTPADACGIIIEGQNKWKTIIENASKPKVA
ncbi:MAG: DDE-type integrase/transposase/recombinase [Nitrososphaerota archaeon]|nr:DDE-type integrase/transposase/recombinase [Nitrososphaerota archaeon]